MYERTLRVLAEYPGLQHSLRFGPVASDFGRDTSATLLCGECGIILLRGPEAWVAADGLIACRNCGAVNDLNSTAAPKSSAKGPLHLTHRREQSEPTAIAPTEGR